MKKHGKYSLNSKVEVDELLIGGPAKDKRSRKKGEKKLVVMAPEKVIGNKIGRAYAQVKEYSVQLFTKFFRKFKMFVQVFG